MATTTTVPPPGVSTIPPHGALPGPGAGAGQPGAQNVVYYVYQMGAPPAHAGASGPAMDWSVCFSRYFLRTALNFLNIASWVIYIAGTAKAQSNCNQGYYDSPNTYPVPPLQFAMLSNSTANSANGVTYGFTTGDCVTIYGLLWWSVWLQFIAVVVATATTFAVFSQRSWVRSVFTPTMYFFIMSSVLLFFVADTYNQQTWILNKKGDNNLNQRTQWVAATTLVLVGSIACLICNFIWIVWNSFNDVPANANVPAVPAHHNVDGDAFVVPADNKAPTVAPMAGAHAPTTAVAMAPAHTAV